MVEDVTPERQVFSVGHSNQSVEALIALLKQHAIEAVVDTRSYPASKYAPQFNRAALELRLPAESIKYKFRGDELGGRPKDHELYDDDGHVLYSRVAEADFFRVGIERLLRGADRYRLALLCSEEDPAACHRRLLIGRVLATHGVAMTHIRGDGRLEPETEYVPGRVTPPPARQLGLFGEPEVDEWKSAQSVLPRSPRASSSAH